MSARIDRRWSLALCAALATACQVERGALPAPVYDRDVAVILEERCGRCHTGDAATAYRVDSYVQVIGCSDSARTRSALQPGDAGVPLIAALERDDHEGLLEPAEAARLQAWVERGAPLRERGVHGSGVLDPRSPEWHGRLAAADRFGPLKDAGHPSACGRCHAGAPVAPAGVRHPAAGAPACTSCHDQPQGVLACGTCHGDGGERAHPPRDACLFPDERGPDAHRAHVESTRLRADPLPCSACHPSADAHLTGTHGNGRIDIAFDPMLAGAETSFDGLRRTCAVACHDRGGARARPDFREPGPFDCNDCHGAPPADHFAGECGECHVEAVASGAALDATELHMNGRVDVADGNPTCGSCHGSGDDPMPRTPGHVVHRETRLTADIECGDCHRVPDAITSDDHLDRGAENPAEVVFGARARAFDRHPTYEGGTCREIACHGSGLPGVRDRELRWDDRATGSCNGCHELPPAGDHPRETSCATLICHGSEVTAGSVPGISEAGRRLHIDGKIDVGGD